jgi:type IV pilus assembly protein PilC
MLLTAKVRDRTGLERFIEREALSSSDLAAQLRREGMVVLSVTESEGLSLKTKKRHLFSRRRMSTFSVEMGLRQLSSMLSSGVALLLSLRTVSEQSSTKKAKKLWADVADRIYGGSSFSAALEENIKTFGAITVRLAEVGERSGELENAMRRAADQLESARNLRTAVVNALVYPVLTLLMTVGVCTYLVGVVIPKLGEFLNESGAQLPGITQLLIDISHWFADYSFYVLFFAIAAVLAWFTVRQNKSGREFEDVLLLKLPVVGKILRVAGTAVFSRAMQIMTESGVTLLDSMVSAEKILSNARLKRRINEAHLIILSGGSLSDSLSRAKEFMPMLWHMASVGEVSGSLPGVFEETARFHELQLAITIKRLGILIEPVMIAITAVIVGFVYIAFFMALFAIATAG